MPFEDFYNESKDTRHYIRLVVAALIVLILLIFGFRVYNYLTSYFEQRKPHKYVLSYSLKDPMRLRMFELCRNLPTPENFIFENCADNPGSDSYTAICYYRSPRTFEEIMPTYLVWFNENGWEHIQSPKSIFTKGNQSVYITKITYYDPEFRYGVYCSEKY